MAFFGNLMNNYFYGKQGKGDYTVASMPQNRRQLFGVVLKVRWSTMVGVNLLYVVVWIPAVLWTVLNVLTLYNLAAGGAATAAQAIAGLPMNYLLLLAPCVAITGPFNAGVTYVLRNWARDEHSFVLSDFKDAVKANWKQALGVSVISGALPFLVYVAWRFYGALLPRSGLFMLPIALVLLVGILWNLSSMVMYVMLVTYELRFRDVIRNALLLTLARLPYAVLIRLATLAAPALLALVLWFFPGVQLYALLIAAMLYLLFMVAFNKLLTVSYANWLCETYLNPRIEGARTDIGLRPENWDDVEYLPQDDDPD